MAEPMRRTEEMGRVTMSRVQTNPGIRGPVPAVAKGLLALFLAGSVMACKDEPAAEAALSVSTDNLDFGSHPLGSWGELDVTVENTGGASFEVLSASLIEGASSAWAVSRDGPGILEGGMVETITVRFEPSEVGGAQGRVQIRTDFPGSESLYVTLSGTGTPSETDEDGDGFSPADGDCDDENAAVSPAEEEICDGVDTDCDGELPADEADADYDGVLVCEGDCDDDDANVYPGAEEICDDKDSDCDGDDADYDDVDEDGYTICEGDCDDSDPDSWPSNPEICDLIDNDCNGTVDDIDEDGDGHSPCAGGGDCDDDDASAFPVIVDAEAADGGDGTLELPYDTIADGIEGLDDVCRTLVLMPGDYAAQVSWTDGPLQVNGGGDGPDEVVLQGDEESPARFFDVADGAELNVVNLTLRGGSGDGDGGAIRATGADVSLQGVILDSNTSSGDGGAIAVSSGTLTLDGCTFESNTSQDDGGALAVVSGIFSDTGSTYTGNSGVRGGAAVIESTSASIDGAWYQGNAAADRGGAIDVVGGSIALYRSDFLENGAEESGGGVALSDLAEAGTEVRNNRLQANVSGEAGGGIMLTGTLIQGIVANNTLVDNGAGEGAGGIAVDATYADGLWVWSNIVGWSSASTGVSVAEGSGASVGWNTVYGTSGGTELEIEMDEDIGENLETNPELTDFSDNGDYTDDDLTPATGSPSIDSGPPDGSGDESWLDTDGSDNDRGYTGGPEAE